MPSTASSTYQDFIEGKLIAAIGTGTTTGITVKIKQVNGATPTWPTAAHRIKIVQKTATNNKVEKLGIASGTSQSGQTVTLGTATRALSLSDGTTFSGSAGTAQSFAAGADVFITWDNHDAAQSAKLDLANTFTTHQTISSTNELRFADSATAIWDDGTDLNFKSSAQATRTLSQLASLSGANDKFKVSSDDTTENYAASKLTGGDGITVTETGGGGNETLDFDVELASDPGLEFSSGALRAKVKASGGVTRDSDGLSVNEADLGFSNNRTIWIPATSMSIVTSSALTNNNSSSGVRFVVTYFDTTTQEYAIASMVLPDDWGGGTLSVKFVWISATNDGNSVVWGITGTALNDGDDVNTITEGTQATVADAGTAGASVYAKVSGAATLTVGNSPNVGDVVTFEITRVTGDGSDTYSGDAGLIGIIITYT